MILKKLCNIIAVSGYESNIITYIEKLLKSKTSYEIYKDNIGNLIVHKKGIGSKILFLAHIDEVGFQIIKSFKDNYYNFKCLGSIKTWNLINQKVTFLTGQTGFVYLKDGIYEPKQSNDLYIYSSEKLLTGSVASFSPNFYENDKNYISKSLDNRISVAGLLEILLKLEALINCNFYCVFTVQEEIGLRGAKVAVSTIKPDFIFNLDTSAIGERNNLEIGLGVGLKISDSIGVSDEKLVNVLTKICQNFNIQYQLEVSDCGTTEMIMVNENDYGSRVVGISLPCQYPHSAFSIVDKKDYIQYKKLLSKIIYNINNVIC